MLVALLIIVAFVAGAICDRCGLIKKWLNI